MIEAFKDFKFKPGDVVQPKAGHYRMAVVSRVLEDVGDLLSRSYRCRICGAPGAATGVALSLAEFFETELEAAVVPALGDRQRIIDKAAAAMEEAVWDLAACETAEAVKAWLEGKR